MDVSHLCSFYHEPLYTWIKINVNTFAIWNNTTLKLAIQALRSYLKLTREYEFYIQPNTKESGLAEVSLLCSFYHEPLLTRIKIYLNKFAIWDHITLKLATEFVRSYLKLACEYELHTSSNTKVSAAKVYGQIYMKVTSPIFPPFFP